MEVVPREAEVGKLEGLLAAPALYTREPVKFQTATGALAASEAAWLLLEGKAVG